MSYRTVRRIGEGGFSEIFEVEDPESALPERLILKRLNAEMSARPQVREAFADEAKFLRELKHPNVVTFRRCYFDERQRICLVMEKVEGEPLDVWARRHAAAPERVLDLFDRVLAAVDYLHHRAVPFLHLDLKPDNVLVASTPEGPQPILIDFGIARRSGERGLKAYTPPYGAPEQERGGTLDGSTDVYALGQILTELLEMIGASLAPPVLAALSEVTGKAKKPSRRERFEDAGQMRVALRRARTARPAVSPLSLPRLPSLPTLPRLPRWSLAAGAGTLALLVVAALVALAGRPHPPPSPAPREEVSAEPRRLFIDLRYRFEQALIQEDLGGAALHHREARDFSDSIPGGTEDWLWMKRELDLMSADLSAAENGGPPAETVRALLRQKHLTYQKP